MATMDPANEGSASTGTQDNLLMQLLKKVDAMSSELTSLSTTVSTLQADNTQLQIDNTNLIERLVHAEKSLTIIQKNIGGRFTKFKKLPKELQIMIWKLAARIPQIHIMSEDGASRSKILDIMEACTQAKEAIMEMKLDYFRVSRGLLTYDTNTPLDIGMTMNYINVDLDTFWTTGRDQSHGHFPENVQWICGFCHSPDYPLKCPINRDQCLSTRSELGPPRVHRLALDFLEWHDPTEQHTGEHDDYGSFILPYHNEPDELLLVIGEPAAVTRERDVTFVQPTLGPWNTYLYLTGARGVSKDCAAMKNLHKHAAHLMHEPEVTWEFLEKKFESMMKEYKTERSARRQALVDSGLVTWETIDIRSDMIDLSDWYVPRVKFVEVRERSQLRNWVAPPPGQAPTCFFGDPESGADAEPWGEARPWGDSESSGDEGVDTEDT